MWQSVAFLFVCFSLIESLSASVLPYEWNPAWLRSWRAPMYDWGYGYGMDIGQNAGQDKQFAITAAHGSKSDWGNYNYGGHGEFSKGASFGIGAGERSGNAYENGWGNGWGWGVNKFQLPWAWSGLAAHNPWWWD